MNIRQQRGIKLPLSEIEEFQKNQSFDKQFIRHVMVK